MIAKFADAAWFCVEKLFYAVATRMERRRLR